MYQYLLAKYKSGGEDTCYQFKLVKYIEEAYPECIREFKVKDNRKVNYAPAERWIIYDLILDCQKYSDLDLKLIKDEELKNIAKVVTKAYKNLETKTTKTAIIRLCSMLNVTCKLKDDNEKKINFGGDQNANKQ